MELKTFKHKKTNEIATYKDGILKSSGFSVEIGVEPSSEFWEEIIENIYVPKEGDKVYRIWKDGHKTLGEIIFEPTTNSLHFKALESYERGGGVTTGEIYGLGIYKYEKVVEESNPEFEVLSLKQDSGITDLWTYFPSIGWCRNNNGKRETAPYKTLEEILNNHLCGGIRYYIYSVKRLCDGEIFSIGDKLTEGVIQEITLSDYNDGVYVNTKNYIGLNTKNYIGLPLNKWIKAKPVLFITQDGVEIFEGDGYCKVNNYSDYSIVTGFKAEGEHDAHRGLKFSTKEKAEEYIMLNKPCLSIADIKNIAFTFVHTSDEIRTTIKRLEDLVKSKL